MLFLLLCALSSSFQIEVYTSIDGLLSDQVLSFYQEPEGPLWVGTDKGVCLFDGKQFQYFKEVNQPRDSILGMGAGADGGVWLVGRHGVFSYNEKLGFSQLLDSGRDLIDQYRVDRNGHIWAMTPKTVFTNAPQGTWQSYAAGDALPDRILGGLFVAPGGEVWVTLKNLGLARFDASRGLWDVITKADGLPSHLISSLAWHDDEMWLATFSGLHVMRGEAFYPAPFNAELPSRFMVDLTWSQNGLLWMAFGRQGLASWDGTKLNTYGEPEGLLSGRVDGFVKDGSGRVWARSGDGPVLCDSAGLQVFPAFSTMKNTLFALKAWHRDLVWVGMNGGLARMEKPTFETMMRDLPARSVFFDFEKIVKDSQARLWMPSSAGLGMYDGHFHHFTEQDGLPATHTYWVREDRNGRIWVGSSKGIAIFAAGRFQDLSALPGLKSDFYANMVQDQRGRIWLEDSKRQLLLAPSWPLGPHDEFKLIPLASFVQKVIPRNDGKVVILTLDQILLYDEGITTYSQRKDISFLDGIQRSDTPIDDRQRLWTCENGNLYIQSFEADTQVITIERNGITYFPTDVFFAGDSRAWLNLAVEGPNKARYPAGIALFEDGAITIYDQEDGLPSNILVGFLGTFERWTWLATSRGIAKIRGREVVGIGVPEGLAGNLVRDLLPMGPGRFLAATNNGLNLISDTHVTSFVGQDGLLDSDVCDLAIDAQNQVWLRTRGGVQRFFPKPGGLFLKLAEVTADGVPLPLIGQPNIEYKHNRLRFQVDAIHMGSGADQLLFRYEIAKENNVQTVESDKNFLFLPSLGAGEYALKVTAFDRFHTASAPILYRFTIKPPLYANPYLLFAVMVGVILLATAVNRMLARAKLERDRIVRELQAARRLQMSLLPRAMPKVAGLDVFGVCMPANEVGGDYFDFFQDEVHDTKLGLTVFDVSGKAMEAAIISVLCSGLVAGRRKDGSSPASICEAINGPLYEKTEKNVFVTGIAAWFQDRKLIWANAGHSDPILVRQGRRQMLPVGPRKDLALGALRHWQYVQREFVLEVGDILVFFSDGASEATAADGQLLGEEGLVSCLIEHGGLGAEALTHKVLACIRAFELGAEQHDDITLVVVKVEA